MKINTQSTPVQLSLLQKCPRSGLSVTPAALLEAGGLWLLVLLCGLALVAALLLAIQTREVAEMQRARLQVTLSELSERLEKDLALGFDLSDDSQAQLLIEDLIDRDRGLQSIEIFDINGVSLFNTDRGSIGEHVPEPWLQAAAKGNRGQAWQAQGPDETVLGITIQGPLREAAGFVAATLAATALPAPGRFALHVLVAAGLICLLAPWCLRWALRGDASVARERVIAMGVNRVLQAHVRLQLASAALREADPAPA